jgi:hypothetical protein
MFNRDDLRALIATGLMIAFGYASMYVLVYFAEYLKILVD